jgi:hypothetical protein
MSDSNTPIQSSGQVVQAGVDLLNPDLWKNRRRMAYISLLSMIASIACVIFMSYTSVSSERIKIVVDLLQVYYVTSSSIIAAYIGFSTWSMTKGGPK